MDEELKEVSISPDTQWRIAFGQTKVFPEQVVAELALSLSRSLDCHVPTTECEAAVAGFVRALQARGWSVRQP